MAKATSTVHKKNIHKSPLAQLKQAKAFSLMQAKQHFPDSLDLQDVASSLPKKQSLGVARMNLQSSPQKVSQASLKKRRTNTLF